MGDDDTEDTNETYDLESLSCSPAQIFCLANDDDDADDTDDADDAGDTGDTGDAGDAGDADDADDADDTGDSGDSGDAGDTGDTGDDGDASDISDGGDAEDTNETFDLESLPCSLVQDSPGSAGCFSHHRLFGTFCEKNIVICVCVCVCVCVLFRVRVRIIGLMDFRCLLFILSFLKNSLTHLLPIPIINFSLQQSEK